MASSHTDENELLPITWPFRAAGTVLILTTVWFCMGWGIRDLGPKEKLPNHMNGFWLGLLLTVVLVVAGALMNWLRERRRLSGLQHGA
ncbi:MAG: hypothetical protein U0Y82_06845 [Thermoleophilia bacterium]